MKRMGGFLLNGSLPHACSWRTTAMRNQRERVAIAHGQVALWRRAFSENSVRMVISSKHDMIVGGLVAVTGILVTGRSYMLSAPGSSSIVAWGAIVFGGIQFAKGLDRWEKVDRRRPDSPTIERDVPRALPRLGPPATEHGSGLIRMIPIILLLAIIGLVVWELMKK
jgi:hypothetical protein